MEKEQEEIVEKFRSHFKRKMCKPMVIYGTGISAEALITKCRDYPIAGVMDLAKTGEYFCGLPVLSQDEMVEKRLKRIIVAARPSVHGIIYKRIQRWCKEYGIEVLDIYGNDVAEKTANHERSLPYFQKTYEDLKREIDAHEVISFDVFDTLLMRKVYEPTDVFLLMDLELSDRFPFVFSKERKSAEQRRRENTEPTIYEIYREIGEKNGLSGEVLQELLELEIAYEKRVLCIRERMKRCMEYCVRQGKEVYLVSDMYFPAEILEELLEEQGITGYRELLVSCDYGTPKPGRLFDILREKTGGNCLHIGDQMEADYCSPKRHGMDAFLIMPAVGMMECSAYSDALVYLGNIESRVMLGMLASQVFNDPFALCESKGLPEIRDGETFGYALIAPLVLSFAVWLFHEVKKQKNSVLLFSARDGWLIQKVFRKLKAGWRLSGLPQDVYFMVSRKALEIADGEDVQAGKRYREYLDKLELGRYEEIYFFDFMSRGTCQWMLEKISGRKCKGLYFQKSVSGIAGKDAIEVRAYLEETSVQEKEWRIFALCDFLECILTSYEPSFIRFDENGSSIFDKEGRTAKQMDILKQIHAGILRYCDDFAGIMPKLPEDMPPYMFCDEILRYLSSEYSRIGIPGLEDFVLDDWLGGDKNTGRDALL